MFDLVAVAVDMSPMSVLSLINVSELEMGPSSIISHFVAVIALLRTI